MSIKSTIELAGEDEMSVTPFIIVTTWLTSFLLVTNTPCLFRPMETSNSSARTSAAIPMTSL